MVDNEMKKIIGLLVMSLCMFIGGCSMNRYENQMGEISKDEIQEELPSMAELGWDSIFTNPSQEEIQSYNGKATKRSPYLYGWFTLSDETKYTEYAVDFKVGHLPKGTYCCLGNWQMDYSTLERQYKNVRTEYEGVNAYAGFQNIYATKPKDMSIVEAMKKKVAIKNIKSVIQSVMK